MYNISLTSNDLCVHTIFMRKVKVDMFFILKNIIVINLDLKCSIMSLYEYHLLLWACDLKSIELNLLLFVVISYLCTNLVNLNLVVTRPCKR